MHFVVLHFWPAQGGFGNFYRRLINALSQQGRIIQVQSSMALLREFARVCNSNNTIFIFTSLMFPVVALLKLFSPGIKIHYHVRGDEYTWCRFSGRLVRAQLAIVLQYGLRILGCRFVFVSKDLLEMCQNRIGPLKTARLLPNTLGYVLPPSRPIFNRIALVGDFGTVKNIEWALFALMSGEFCVDVYGNTREVPEWNKPWIKLHGHVRDLSRELENSSIVVLTSTSEGFPWALLDAVRAGCSVLAPTTFPFEYLPIASEWRFEMDGLKEACARALACKPNSLEQRLRLLLAAPRDFRADNPALFSLLETPWEHLLAATLDGTDKGLH